MLAVGALLFVLGLLALIVLLIVAIVARIQKRTGPKRRFIAIALTATIGGFAVAGIAPESGTDAIKSRNAAIASPHKQLPAYLVLRPGQRAYLNSNGQGDDTQGTLFTSWSVVQKWYNGDFDSPNELAHVDLPAGTTVIVDSWRSIGNGKNAKRMVHVHSAKAPARAGYAYDVTLLPLPPAGSTLIVAGLGQPTPKDKGVSMDRTSTYRKNNSIEVKLLSRAVLLDVDQNPDAVSPYHVRIIDGPQRGATGYFMNILLAAPSDGSGGEEYSAWCHCVSLFLNTGNG